MVYCVIIQPLVTKELKDLKEAIMKGEQGKNGDDKFEGKRTLMLTCLSGLRSKE